MAEPRAAVRNAADPEQVKEATRKEKDGLKTERDDVRSILETPYGKRFVWRLLAHCGLFESPFGIDERTTNLNIGRGDVGRFVLDQINDARPEALLEMMQDAKRKETTDA